MMQGRGEGSDLHVQDVHLPSAANSRKALSPKRPQFETGGLADLFPYYAGFSYEWARFTLKAHKLTEDSVVLDPWNGSGTTTVAAQSMGVRSVGVDLNPVANVVASLRAIKKIPEGIGKPRSSRSLLYDDPLNAWFDARTAARLRRWQMWCEDSPTEIKLVTLVALFRVVRNLTAGFQGSNPTWVRRMSPSRPAVSILASDLDKLVIAERSNIADRISESGLIAAPPVIVKATASNLPIADRSADLILTSPPYLTRIDYAVAYSRELAVLGVDIQKDRSLRGDLMGTTLIREADARLLDVRTCAASSLVEQIAKHQSHASGVYYLKQACQYLSDLTSAFDELSRVSKAGAVAVFVVQDSYYKDIPVELAKICEEEAIIRNWKIVNAEPFDVTRTLTSLNRAAKNYAKGRVKETVITMEKQ
ncbi:Methyltransferase domain-containing protein [Amycolatopsis lurida]|uniref:DNA methyltransferase n=1 Tax=Amycolatopsis lurida TaxID=31959 RepID=UPI00089D7D98|nr:DNA methyltransferase [Amycolatopsis lurida]SED50563.1 Methyltransferase domain-containing protein [Amycolatopsis lurida]